MSLSPHAQILNVKQVLSETLAEISAVERCEITENLNRIFTLWQCEHGIYPPRTHKLGRTAHILLCGEDYPTPFSYREYISNFSEKEKPQINPWDCDEDARSPVDLLYKLLANNYEHLQRYLNNDEGSPRFEHVLSVAISMSIQNNTQNEPFIMAYWGSRLLGIREKLQKSVVKKLKPLLSKEYNRKTARSQQANIQRAMAEKRIKKALIKFATRKEGLPKNLQQALADESGIERPSVSKYLKQMKQKDDDVRKIMCLT